MPASPQLAAALIYASGAIAFWRSRCSTSYRPSSCTLAAAAYLAVAVTAVDRQGLLLDLPFPMVNQAFCFLAIMMYRSCSSRLSSAR